MTASWDDIRAGLAAAPEAAQSPSIAASLIQSGFTGADLAGAAQGAVGATQAQAADQVVQAHKSGGMFGFLKSAVNHVRTGVWDHVPGHDAADAAASAVASPLGTVAHWANYPLSQVQHSYRYYHDVVAHHGVAAGLTTILENSVGGPGSLIAQPMLDNAVTQITGNTPTAGGPLPYYQDSWDRSAKAVVSPGRDLAALAGLQKGDTGYGTVSGLGDATFDIAMDPLIKAGSISKALTGSARALATEADVVRAATKVTGPNVLHPSLGPFQRALSDIAKTDSTAKINEHYPQFKGIEGTVAADGTRRLGLSSQLAKADSYDKVVDVLRNHFAEGDNIGKTGTPVLSLTKIPFRSLNERMMTWQQPKGVLNDLVSDPDLGSRATGALASLKDRVSRTANEFANRTPFVITETKTGITKSSVHPMDPAAAHVLYRVLKYGQSEPVARNVADQFAQMTSVADRATIWKNSIVQLADAVGMPADAAFRTRFKADMDGIAHNADNGPNSMYGIDHKGVDRSGVVADGGTMVNAPLFTTQGGDFPIPKLEDFNAGARAARKLGALYGPADDFIYNAFIAPVFKKWALFSMGFAFRNAVSEDMTSMIGRDGMGVIKGGIAGVAARMGHKLLPGEVDDLTVQLGHSADPGLIKRLFTDKDYLDTATQILIRNNGKLETPASVSAGHYTGSYGGDTTQGLADNVARILMPGTKGARLDPDTYVKYTSASGIEKLSNAISGHAVTVAHDEGARIQAQAYRKSLASGATPEEAAQDGTAAGVDWFTNTPAGRAAQDFIKRGPRGMSSAEGVDPLIDWAGQRMATIRGITTNKDGNTIKELLDGIADTRDAAHTHPNLYPSKIKALGIDNVPINGVPGMKINPTSVGTQISRVVEAGYSHVITPIIQELSRTPMYIHIVQDELEHARKLPGLTEDEVWHIAQSRAAERMVSQIHNPLDKSQFAVASRSLLPFFFAREQALRRIARAVHQDPFGWRKLQLAVHGMKDVGFIHTDDQGTMSFNYPVSGELGRYLPLVLSKLGVNTAVGVPSGFAGNITGLASGGEVPGETPFSAGWSPLVTIPIKAAVDSPLNRMFPELSTIANSPLGVGQLGMSQPMWAQLVPNAAVRNGILAYAGDHSRAFYGSMIDAMQFQMTHGNMPPTNAQPGDPAWQKWIDGIRTQTRTMFAVRALMGIGSPTSPILKNGAPQMTTEYQSYLTKYGLADGTQRFLTKYPNAGAYTVFKTEGAGGVNVPETHVAWDWTTANKSFVSKYGEAGSLFIPQTTQADPDALAIYQQEMASGFRHQKLPDEFAQQVMVQQGWNAYEADKANLDASLQGVTDPNQISAAKSNFYSYVTNVLGPSAPLWYAEYNNYSANNKQKTIIAKQLIDIFDQGKAPVSPMTPLLGALVDDYKTYQAALASSASSTVSKSTMKDNWNAYLVQQVAAHPELTTVVNRVFKGA